MRVYAKDLKKSTPKQTEAAKNGGKRYPKPKHEPRIFYADDRALLPTFFLIRIEPRPQMKCSASVEEREDAKSEAVRLALSHLGILNPEGDSVRVKEDGGKRAGHIIGIKPTSAQDLPAVYRWLTSEPVRWLMLAALSKLASTKGAEVEVTTDEVLGPRVYKTPAARKNARFHVKKVIGPGKLLEYIQIYDGNQTTSAVKVEQTPDGWRIRWLSYVKKPGVFWLPSDVVIHKDAHAVQVWLLLVQQKGNGKIKMDTLLSVYNTQQENAAKCRKALVALLHDLEPHGLHIEAIAHRSTRIQNRKADGADYLEARSPKGFYLFYVQEAPAQ